MNMKRLPYDDDDVIPIRQPAWVDVDPVDQDVAAQSFTQPSVPCDDLMIVMFLAMMATKKLFCL